MNRAPSPQNRPDGRSANHRNSPRPRGDILRSRPQIHGVRNSSLSTQVSGDFAEFRQIRRDFHESRPFTAEPAGRRVREPRNFQYPMKIFLHNRPQIRGVRNSTPPSHLSGDFAEFRQIWRNFHESRPFTAEPAGWGPNFQDSMKIFLHNRTQIRGVRNSTLPAKVSGDFAEFRKIWRKSP